jgi:hypothetical protein
MLFYRYIILKILNRFWSIILPKPGPIGAKNKPIYSIKSVPNRKSFINTNVLQTKVLPQAVFDFLNGFHLESRTRRHLNQFTFCFLRPMVNPDAAINRILVKMPLQSI